MRSYIIKGISCLAAVVALAFVGAVPGGQARGEESASAASAARVLRLGAESEDYALWRTAVVHWTLPERETTDVVLAMLENAVGLGPTPPAQGDVMLQNCYDVPLIADGETLSYSMQHNIHGAVYSQSPLISVTAVIMNGGTVEQKAAVAIDPAQNVTYYCLDETEIDGQKDINQQLNFSTLSQGSYKLILSAATSNTPQKELYSASFKIQRVELRYPLTQNNFGDNYHLAKRLFGGDTARFLPEFNLRDDERSISIATTWRETYLVETNIGKFHDRVHLDALFYFQMADYFINHSYVRVDNNGRDSKVRCLNELMEDCGTYVPRFQNNVRYISHHSLGTCADINAYMVPNNDVESNHQLIGEDVREHLTFNGVKTGEDGVLYYDFTYTGSYSGKINRIPKSIVNYLLYELAFYRAGFGWGYYYYNTCDGMHFSLTDVPRERHDDPVRGLRKVYTYTVEWPGAAAAPDVGEG